MNTSILHERYSERDS